MIPVAGEVEKVVFSQEDKKMEEEEEGKDEEAEESGEEGSRSEEDDGNKEPEDESDENGDRKDEALDETKEEEPKAQKPSGSLNLNNEVVNMRKEVKRVRALIIRKLIRQTDMLKKKKGNEADLERNQRRASRLLEEIRAMRVLVPDKVTKTALQKNLNFEQECKNPKSTFSDRAIARIATHPQFNKKIQDIKAAIAAFKEDRKKSGKEKEQTRGAKVIVQSHKKKEKKSGNQKDILVGEQTSMDTEKRDCVLQSTVDVTLTEPNKESRTVIHSDEKTVVSNNKREMPQAKTVRAAMAKNDKVKDVLSPKMKGNHNLHAESEEESDLDTSDDEEKEYFDDSTEERFHKQSSHSEESEEEDDFFVGKVSKFKKKKHRGMETVETSGSKNDHTEEEQSRREKGTSLDSIFCSSLARSKPGRGRGAGRGRNGEGGKGRGESRGFDGPKGAFSKQSKLQEKNAERGRGRGRGGVPRKSDHRDGVVFSPEPALHPSWEASKKRKEQQGQILAFQGKKIKFDDDD